MPTPADLEAVEGSQHGLDGLLDRKGDFTMNFKLNGKDMLCPDTIGNWSKVGTASDLTSPFYKRAPHLANMDGYDHITVPWQAADLVCDGIIHYTAKGPPEFIFGSGNRCRVFKYDFSVTNNGGPTETSRGGLNKDRPIFIFKGDHTAAERTNKQVKSDTDASAEWGQVKSVRKVFDSVKEFWAALLTLQPPAAPVIVPAALWNTSDDHWLLDQTYFGPPSSAPARVVKAFPAFDLESRLKTEIGKLEKIAKASGIRIFILGQQDAGRVTVTKTLKVGEELAKLGYRLRVTPLLGRQEHEVRIHYY
jgi:hypothetical protein